MLTPQQYFQRIKKEKLREVLIFYLIFTVLTAVPASLYYLQQFLLPARWLPAAVVVDLLLSFGGIFLFGALVHLCLRILGGKGNYYDTLKGYIYGSTPNMLWSIPYLLITLAYPSKLLNILLTIVAIYSLYLQVTGLSVLHKISKWKAFFGSVMPFLIIFVFALGIALIVGVIMAILAGGI